MFSFILDEIHVLEDASSIIADLDNLLVDLKFSPEMFSIILDSAPTTPRCFIALQLFPQFFNRYLCHQLQYSWIYIDTFFPTLSDCQLNGFSSLTFSSAGPDRVDLIYEDPNGRVLETGFTMNPTSDSSDIGEFDFDIFVSIDSRVFINVVMALQHFCTNVLVTLTNSLVKFSSEEADDIILPQEGKQCIIGGIEADSEISLNITLQPPETLCSIARRSQRVWLFKADSTSNGLISFPLGLYARFLAYFPYRK